MAESREVLKVKGMEFPLDRLYYVSKGSHLWVRAGDGRARVGMDSFLLNTIGYLNYISISAGDYLQGEVIGNYESAKFVSRVHTPLSGRITRVNEEALENPRSINDDPYGTWLLEMELSSEEELEGEDFISDSQGLRAGVEKELEELDEE